MIGMFGHEKPTRRVIVYVFGVRVFVGVSSSFVHRVQGARHGGVERVVFVEQLV